MQTLNVSTRLEGSIVGKTLTMPKQEDIILNSMTQAKKMELLGFE